ncbi:MAG: hypothetical protein ACRC1Z_24810 [Waterburya sp.]
MKKIQIKKFKTYKYKGFTIGIWKTANKSFIKEGYFSSYLGDGKYLKGKDLEIKKTFKYIYFWDCLFHDGTTMNGMLNDLPAVFSVVCSYRVTEEEAIVEAQEAIDQHLYRQECEKENLVLPSHIYDRSTGQVVPRWRYRR